MIVKATSNEACISVLFEKQKIDECCILQSEPGVGVVLHRQEQSWYMDGKCTNQAVAILLSWNNLVMCLIQCSCLVIDRSVNLPCGIYFQARNQEKKSEGARLSGRDVRPMGAPTEGAPTTNDKQRPN